MIYNMEIKLEQLLEIYTQKAQTHDKKTSDYIKAAILARYQLTEETFKVQYEQFLTGYVNKQLRQMSYGRQ